MAPRRCAMLTRRKRQLDSASRVCKQSNLTLGVSPGRPGRGFPSCEHASSDILRALWWKECGLWSPTGLGQSLGFAHSQLGLSSL